MTKAGNILEEIDQQVDYLLRTRSLYPYMANSPIGQRRFRTAPFYRSKGFDVEFDFGRPLEEEDLAKIRSVGHWINQNFVIRLCALLELHHVIPPKGKGKINQDVSGSDEVDIVRRLRHQFAHSNGRFSRGDNDERRLYQRVVNHFNVVHAAPIDEATDYPLSIDVVLIPLANGCKKYVLEEHGA